MYPWDTVEMLRCNKASALQHREKCQAKVAYPAIHKLWRKFRIQLPKARRRGSNFRQAREKGNMGSGFHTALRKISSFKLIRCPQTPSLLSSLLIGSLWGQGFCLQSFSTGELGCNAAIPISARQRVNTQCRSIDPVWLQREAHIASPSGKAHCSASLLFASSSRDFY